MSLREAVTLLLLVLYVSGIDLHNHWITIDLTINILFLVEFAARILFVPSKVAFIKDFANWLDCIAVLPYFLLLLCTEQGNERTVTETD